MLRVKHFFLTGLIGLALPCLVLAQGRDSLYWEQHVQPLDLKDDSLFASFDMLDSVVENYQFFFTAEQHWKTINTQIQFAFFDLSSPKSRREKSDLGRGLCLRIPDQSLSANWRQTFAQKGAKQHPSMPRRSGKDV